MSTVQEPTSECKPRASLWTKISPLALGIHPQQLLVSSPAQKAAAIRAAAAQLARLADELEAKL
jgi:hypothetical protein